MKKKQITVADLIKFLQTMPLDATVRVKTEDHDYMTSTTRYVSVEKCDDSDGVFGISYWKTGNAIDFGID